LTGLEEPDRVEAEFFGVTIAAHATAIAIHGGIGDNAGLFQLVIVEELNASHNRSCFYGVAW
jgi:hypothetical protein